MISRFVDSIEAGSMVVRVVIREGHAPLARARVRTRTQGRKCPIDKSRGGEVAHSTAQSMALEPQCFGALWDYVQLSH